ncbi:MAG: homocitrate synthase/isopropylmalate synthase family protein [Promethearchaeota archaeon]
MWVNAWAYMRMDKDQRWWSYEWNFTESIRKQMHLPNKIIVKDDTLREGEETPGTYFTIDQKIEIAKLLEEMGIPEVEVGYAAGIQEHAETFKALKREKIKMKLSSHARLYAEDIKKEVDDIIAAEADHINFLLVPSPALKSRKEVFERITEGIEYAKDQGAYVAFGSGRVIPKYWKKFLRLALDAGVDRVVVYDGNGCALPTAFKDNVMFTKNIVGDIPVEVHTHQDLGLATATTLAGVEGGAEIVDVIFNGLGDRAGNAALEEVVMALEILYGINLNLKLDMLLEISQLIEKYSKTPVQPNKAIVGKNCFIHESDLHVEQILIGNWVTWELYQPHVVGQTRKLIFGATTLQDRALKAKLNKMGLDPTQEHIDTLREKMKEKIKSQDFISEEELEDFARKIII